MDHDLQRRQPNDPSQKGSTTVSYSYAGPDQTEMVKAGNATFVYGLADQNGQPWIQSYQNGSTATWIEHDGNGTPLGFFDGSNDYAYATDGLGSVVAVISTSGTQAASYTYSPYGETTADTGWEANINLIRYTGAFTDPNTNWMKLGRRFYNPSQGRFTQQDTINKLADTTNGNKYAYAGDNSINNIDPSGNLSFDANIEGCFVICVGGGYGRDTEGGSGWFIQLGAGSPSIHGGLSESGGTVSSGSSVTAEGNVGLVGAGYGTQGGEYQLGSVSTDPEFDVSWKYTF